MREIVFDTETTGLDWRDERIIELGGVELVNRFPTGRTFHRYLNPQGRGIDPEAQAIHGITAADLADKPTFADIADEFLEFIDGANLVAHNSGFDMAFINAELERATRTLTINAGVRATLDTQVNAITLAGPLAGSGALTTTGSALVARGRFTQSGRRRSRIVSARTCRSSSHRRAK